MQLYLKSREVATVTSKSVLHVGCIWIELRNLLVVHLQRTTQAVAVVLSTTATQQRSHRTQLLFPTERQHKHNGIFFSSQIFIYPKISRITISISSWLFLAPISDNLNKMLQDLLSGNIHCQGHNILQNLFKISGNSYWFLQIPKGQFCFPHQESVNFLLKIATAQSCLNNG